MADHWTEIFIPFSKIQGRRYVGGRPSRLDPTMDYFFKFNLVSNRLYDSNNKFWKQVNENKFKLEIYES